MQREPAEYVCNETLRCCRKLNQALGSLQGSVDPVFFQRFKKETGQIMGNLYFDVLCRVFDEYPDLEPEWKKRNG